MSAPPGSLDGAQGGAVFRVVGLTKVYEMGEVQVYALRGVTLDVDESVSTCQRPARSSTAAASSPPQTSER